MMQPDERPLRVALAGLGTVGAGVVRLIDENGAILRQRAGRPIEIVAVSARDRAKDRGVDISRFRWTDDMGEFATAEDIDVVVELVGGADGPALTLARESLAAGKGFVTANKAMIAHHGLDLAARAEAAGLALKYEAAVAGGIPVIKGLREGAAANRIVRVYGILNGTCNFILSAMEADGRDFAAVLADAQAKGFAEADPSFDIDGVDAAHKLSILASLSFGTRVDFAGVDVGGIRRIIAADIAQARALGYRVRLIGLAEVDGSNGDARLFQRVAPVLVPLHHPLAAVEGATNAVVMEGNFVGRLLFQGAGAGDGPTASAVVADLVDIARGEMGPAFSIPTAALAGPGRAEAGHRRAKYYLRMEVADKPGVLAEVATAMRDAGVSIDSLIQTEAQDGEAEDGSGGEERALIAMVTHRCEERCVTDTLAALAGSDSIVGVPMWMQLIDN